MLPKGNASQWGHMAGEAKLQENVIIINNIQLLPDGDKVRHTTYRALADPKNSLEDENLETETIHRNQIHLNSNETHGTNSENKKLVQISRPRNGYSLQLF